MKIDLKQSEKILNEFDKEFSNIIKSINDLEERRPIVSALITFLLVRIKLSDVDIAGILESIKFELFCKQNKFKRKN